MQSHRSPHVVFWSISARLGILVMTLVLSARAMSEEAEPTQPHKDLVTVPWLGTERSTDDVLRSLEKIGVNAPNSSAARFWRAAILAESGREDEAVDLLLGLLAKPGVVGAQEQQLPSGEDFSWDWSVDAIGAEWLSPIRLNAGSERSSFEETFSRISTDPTDGATALEKIRLIAWSWDAGKRVGLAARLAAKGVQDPALLLEIPPVPDHGASISGSLLRRYPDHLKLHAAWLARWSPERAEFGDRDLMERCYTLLRGSSPEMAFTAASYMASFDLAKSSRMLDELVVELTKDGLRNGDKFQMAYEWLIRLSVEMNRRKQDDRDTITPMASKLGNAMVGALKSQVGEEADEVAYRMYQAREIFHSLIDLNAWSPAVEIADMIERSEAKSSEITIQENQDMGNDSSLPLNLMGLHLAIPAPDLDDEDPDEPGNAVEMTEEFRSQLNALTSPAMKICLLQRMGHTALAREALAEWQGKNERDHRPDIVAAWCEMQRGEWMAADAALAHALEKQSFPKDSIQNIQLKRISLRSRAGNLAQASTREILNKLRAGKHGSQLSYQIAEMLTRAGQESAAKEWLKDAEEIIGKERVEYEKTLQKQNSDAPARSSMEDSSENTDSPPPEVPVGPPSPTLEEKRASLEKQLASDPGDVLTRGLLAVIHARMSDWDKVQSTMNGLPRATSEAAMALILEEAISRTGESLQNDAAAINFATAWLKGEMARPNARVLPSVRERMFELLAHHAVRRAIYSINRPEESSDSSAETREVIVACETLSTSMLAYSAFGDLAFRFYRGILFAQGKEDPDLVQKALVIFQDAQKSRDYGSSQNVMGFVSGLGGGVGESLEEFLIDRLAKEGRRDDLEKLVFPKIKSRDGDSVEAMARSTADLWTCAANEFSDSATKHLELLGMREQEGLAKILDVWQTRGLEVSLDDLMLANAEWAIRNPSDENRQSSGNRYVIARLAAGKPVDALVREIMTRIVGENSEVRSSRFARAFPGSKDIEAAETMKIHRAREFGQWLAELYQNPVAWPLFGIARETGLATHPDWFAAVFQNMCTVAADHPEHVGLLVTNLGMLEDADTLIPLYVDDERTRTFYQISEILGQAPGISRSLDALHASLDEVKTATLGSSLLKLALDENPAEAVEGWLINDGTAASIQRIPEPRRAAVIASFKHLIKGYPVSTAMRPDISRILKDCGDAELKSLMDVVREWELDENCAEYEEFIHAGWLGEFIARNIIQDDPENTAILLLGLEKVDHYRVKPSKDKLQIHLPSLRYIESAAQSDFLWHDCVDLAEKRNYIKHPLWQNRFDKGDFVPRLSEGMFHLLTSGRFGADAKNFDPLGHKDLKMPEPWSLGWRLAYIHSDERSLAIQRLEKNADTFGKKLVLAVLRQNNQELFKFVTDHTRDFAMIPHERHPGVLHVLAASSPAFNNAPWDLPPDVFKVLRGYYPEKELAVRRAIADGTDDYKPIISKLSETILKTNASTFAPGLDDFGTTVFWSLIEKTRKEPSFKVAVEKAMLQCGATFGGDFFRAALAGSDAAMLDFTRKHRNDLLRVRPQYDQPLLQAIAGEEMASWSRLSERSPEWKEVLEPLMQDLRPLAQAQLAALMKAESLQAIGSVLRDPKTSRPGLDTLIYLNPEAASGLLEHIYTIAKASDTKSGRQIVPYELRNGMDGPRVCDAIRAWMNTHPLPENTDIPITRYGKKIWEVKRYPEALVADWDQHGLFAGPEKFHPCKLCGAGKRWLGVLAGNSPGNQATAASDPRAIPYRDAILAKANSMKPVTFGAAFWLAALGSSPESSVPEFIKTWSSQFEKLSPDSRADVYSMLREVWKKMPDLDHMPEELRKQLAPLMAQEIQRRAEFVDKLLEHSPTDTKPFVDQKTFVATAYPAIRSLAGTDPARAAKAFIAACRYRASGHDYFDFSSEQWLRKFTDDMDFPSNMTFRHRICLLERNAKLFDERTSQLDWADGKIMTAAWRDEGGEAWPVPATSKVLEKLETAFDGMPTGLLAMEFDPWLDALAPSDRQDIERWSLDQVNSSSRVTRELATLVRVRMFAAAVRVGPLENDPDLDSDGVWKPYFELLRTSTSESSLPVVLGAYFCQHYPDAVPREWVFTSLEKFVESKPEYVAPVASRLNALLRKFVEYPRDERWKTVNKMVCDLLAAEIPANYTGRISKELLIDIMPPRMWDGIFGKGDGQPSGSPENGTSVLFALNGRPKAAVREWSLDLKFADGRRISFLRPRDVVEEAIKQVNEAAADPASKEMLLAANIFFINSSDPPPLLEKRLGAFLPREKQIEDHVQRILSAPSGTSPWRNRALALTVLAFPETYPELKPKLLEIAAGADIGKVVKDKEMRVPLSVMPWATRAAIKLAEGDPSVAIAEMERINEAGVELGELQYVNIQFSNALDAYAEMVLRMYPMAVSEVSAPHPEACQQWVEWLMSHYKDMLDSNTRIGWLGYGVAMKSTAGGSALPDWWNGMPKNLKDRVLKGQGFEDAVFHFTRSIAGNDKNRQSIEVRLKMAESLLQTSIMRHLAGEGGIENVIVRQTGLLSLDEAVTHSQVLQAAWPEDKRFYLRLAEEFLALGDDAQAIALFSRAAEDSDSPQEAAGYRLRQAARLIRIGRAQEAEVVLGKVSATTLSAAGRRLYDSLTAGQ